MNQRERLLSKGGKKVVVAGTTYLKVLVKTTPIKAVTGEVVGNLPSFTYIKV